MIRLRFGVGVASVIAAATGSARADSPAESLADGRLIVSADRVAPVLTYDSVTATQGGAGQAAVTTKTVTLGFASQGRLAAFYATPRLAIDGIVSHFTFGGSIWVSTQLSASVETRAFGVSGSQDQGKATYWGIAPRAGYILPVGEIVAFWPRIGVEYHSVSTGSTTILGVTSRGSTQSETAVDLEANLVVTPWHHFGMLVTGYGAIPVGGSFQPDGGQSTDVSEVVVGLTLGLLGYF